MVSSAYARFQSIEEPASLTSVENALADVFVRQHRFSAARPLYEQALRRAAEAGLDVIQALTECNLGNLALARGRYDQALEYLERLRRRYHALGMPHESAYADLELTEAYLELNLIAEADAIYARVTPVFASLGCAPSRHGRWHTPGKRRCSLATTLPHVNDFFRRASCSRLKETR